MLIFPYTFEMADRDRELSKSAWNLWGQFRYICTCYTQSLPVCQQTMHCKANPKRVSRENWTITHITKTIHTHNNNITRRFVANKHMFTNVHRYEWHVVIGVNIFVFIFFSFFFSQKTCMNKKWNSNKTKGEKIMCDHSVIINNKLHCHIWIAKIDFTNKLYLNDR